MDDDHDLFVVVSWEDYSQCFTSILQLETLGINHDYDPSTQEAPVVQSDFSVTFRLPVPPPTSPTPSVQWGYALLGEDLHMVPDWCWGPHEDVDLRSCLFNLKTKKHKRLRTPLARKWGGHVVSLRGHTYFMAHPGTDSEAPHPAFERYNPLKDEWEELEHIPQDAIIGCLGVSGGSINATAVWDDTILFTVFSHRFWAYNVVNKKWYRVQVNNPFYCNIVGEAFVLGNTIYALSGRGFDKVAAISIEKEGSNADDLVYKCSFLELISVPGISDIEFEYDEERPMYRHLVHLGGYNFCLLHSCRSLYTEDYQYQRIQLTHIKLIKGEKSMTVTNKCVHEFKVERDEEFKVRHCFSLPKHKTTDLKEGKTSFVFDPFPRSFLSRRKSIPKYKDITYFNLDCEVVKPVQEEENDTLPQDVPLLDVQGAPSELDAKSNVASRASTISAVIGHPSHAYEKSSLASTLGIGAASERSNTDEEAEGHSICAVKLSRDVSVSHLVYVLKRFGPIKRVWIHVKANTTRKPCAHVEFESAAAKQLAIEASPMIIGGRRAVVQNIRRKAGVFVTCEGDLSDMAEAPAAVAPQPVSAQVLGNAFVHQYYQILHDSPALVHRFYQDISKLVRPEDDGSISVTTTLNAINEKILSLNYGDFRAEIKSVDAHESFSGVVQVLVNGYLTGIDNRIRNFFQCFLLAPQDQGFFVLNDVFSYVESSNQPHVEQVLVDDAVVVDPVSQEQSPVPHAVQESRVFHEGDHVDEVTKGRVLNPPENVDVPVVEEEVKEVVDEVHDDSPPVVESYAAIVKRSLS